MTTRARTKLDFACRLNLTSDAAYSRGQEVKFGADDNSFTAAGTNDPLAIGTLERNVSASGKKGDIILYGHAIVPVLVGTGGATRGVNATTVADGFTNAAANGGGTTSQIIKGQFTESGVAGDIVGMVIGVNPRSVKA